MHCPDIAVIVPYFQRTTGLLKAALASAFSQAHPERLKVVVVDDGSPWPAERELEEAKGLPRESIDLIVRPNGGAGAARNSALESLSPDIRYVAFLDSDDVWRPGHLESALHTLETGVDAHFSDWCSFNYPGQSNFERIGPPHTTPELALDESGRYFQLGESALEHVVGQGGGVIQTSTVVYRFDRFRDLRFREQFYNGQDLVFWMDMSERGARFAFCLDVECDNGEGINIYQRAGWGTQRSMQRLRNELFLWTSVEKYYALPVALRRRNRETIRHLQEAVIRDVLHRVRRRVPVPSALLKQIVHMSPGIIAMAPVMPFKVLAERLMRR